MIFFCRINGVEQSLKVVTTDFRDPNAHYRFERKQGIKYRPIAAMKMSNWDEGTCFIDSFNIIGDVNRRQGYGSCIYDFMEEKVFRKLRRCDEVHIHATYDAFPFWEQMGFEVDDEDELKHAKKEGEGTIVMTRFLE